MHRVQESTTGHSKQHSNRINAPKRKSTTSLKKRHNRHKVLPTGPSSTLIPTTPLNIECNDNIIKPTPSISHKKRPHSNRFFSTTQPTPTDHTPTTDPSTTLISKDDINNVSTATINPPEPDNDEKVSETPSRFRFAIPPQRLKRLPYLNSLKDTFLNPLQHLDPSNFVYPDYALLMDFQEKESLLGWKIITDSELNGTSEASLAWGSAKNPVTGEPMRTIVFQGRIGEIILPKQILTGKSGNNSIKSIIQNTFGKSEASDHARLIQSVAQDPEADFGDQTIENYDSPYEISEYGAVHGFVGLMSPDLPPLDLSYWDTFNICVRTDSGPWLASTKPVPSHGADLFMAGVPGPDGKVINPRKTLGFLRKPMRNLFVPIDQLTVTKNGRSTNVLKTSNEVPIEGFGFSIRGPPGPFKIEIGWVAVANSLGNVQKEEHLPAPSQHIKVNLDQNVIEATAKMDDIQLYKYIHNDKGKLDQAALEQAKKYTQKKDSQFEKDSIISIDSIESNQPSESVRKKLLAQKLGVDVSQIEDLEQEKARSTPLDETIIDAYDLPPVAKRAIKNMNTLLEGTLTRAGRLSRGISSNQYIDPKTGAVLPPNRREVDLLQQDHEAVSLDRELSLFTLQTKAKELTGVENPLIVPVYSEENVMAQARVNALQSGFITEKQWERYALTERTLDPHKAEKRMQTLESKIARQAFEHAWNDTNAAAQIRAEAEKEKELIQQKHLDSYNLDEKNKASGQIRSRYDSKLREDGSFTQEPPVDYYDFMEKNALNFKGATAVHDIDDPNNSFNLNQTKSFLSPKYAQGGTNNQENNGNGVKH
jgi:hypothetical protein